MSRAYSYDVNGNALSDGANGFQYNYLNLITAVTGTNAATYTYDANGKKLSRVAGGVTTDYLDGIQYANGTIEFVQTEEGIARRITDLNYSYEYSLKDHLGNSRLSFDGSGTTIQSDSYYPFGKTFNSFVSGIKNNYLYNGKEFQDGLKQYDYGARFYDPEIGRWNVVDPLAEKFYSVNPYNYTDNNPVNNIDPNGMETYYGQEAQDMFRQLQSQTSSQQNDPEDPKKKQGKQEQSKGYFPTLWNELKKYDPFGNAGRTWTGWLSEKSTLGSDLWNTVKGTAAIVDPDTYTNFYEYQKVYWSASAEDKAKMDAAEISSTVEGVATAAPFAYAGAEIAASKISPSDFVRTGNTVVSNQLIKGKGSTGATIVRGVKGGGTNPATGVTLPYHFHIHQYNWSKPFSWFQQTPILKAKK